MDVPRSDHILVQVVDNVPLTGQKLGLVNQLGHAIHLYQVLNVLLLVESLACNEELLMAIDASATL